MVTRRPPLRGEWLLTLTDYRMIDGSLATCRYGSSRRVRRPEQSSTFDQALDPRYPFLDPPGTFFQPPKARLDRVDAHSQPPEHGQHLPGQGRAHTQDSNKFRTHARIHARSLATRESGLLL